MPDLVIGRLRASVRVEMPAALVRRAAGRNVTRAQQRDRSLHGRILSRVTVAFAPR